MKVRFAPSPTGSRHTLTGRDSGPELWSVLAALPLDETLRRVDAAL